MKREKPTSRAAGLAKTVAPKERAATRRAHALVALILRRKHRIMEDFYELGTALRELLEKKLYVALGHASFDELLEKHDLMGRTQAYKLIALVKGMTRDDALAFGQEKAYALARLLAATPEPDTVDSLRVTGVRVGKQRRSPADMSRREIESATRTLRKKRAPSSEDAALKGVTDSLRAIGVKEVTVTSLRRGQWLRIDLPMADLPKLVARLPRRARK
jgi:hypothetical protein